MITQYPDLGATYYLRALAERFPSWDLPSYGAVVRYCQSWKHKNAEVLTAIRNPDEWKNKSMIAFGSYSDHLNRPNELWELDSTPADLYFADGRWNLIGCVDVWTRRLNMILTKTSKAEAIALLLRDCLIEWGVPTKIKTDNGQDYRSKHIGRVCAALDIGQDFCQKFSPWEKPHIERGLQIFSHDLIKLKPEFIGHSVADRKAIEARQTFSERLFKKDETIILSCTAENFAQDFLDTWLSAYNQGHKHSSLDGMTPLQKAATYRGTITRIADERVLDVLLAKAPQGDGARKIGKRGIILDHKTYIDIALEALIGQTVAIRYDPRDPDTIYCFDRDSATYLCTATNSEAISRTARQQIAVVAKNRQTERVQDEKRELKRKSKRLLGKNLADRINQFEADQASNLVALPNPTQEHTSEWIEGAKQLIASVDATPAHLRQASAEEEARLTELEQQHQEQKAKQELWRQAEQAKRDASVKVLAAWRQGEMPSPDELELAIEFVLAPESAGWRYENFADDYSAEKRFQRWLNNRRQEAV